MSCATLAALVTDTFHLNHGLTCQASQSHSPYAKRNKPHGPEIVIHAPCTPWMPPAASGAGSNLLVAQQMQQRETGRCVERAAPGQALQHVAL